MTAVERISAALDDLIEVDAEIEHLATGFGFTEGPIWHPRDRYLLFSDIPLSLRRRWSAAGGAEEARRNTNRANGMTYDAAGHLIVCEHATSRVVREAPDGSQEVLASHFRGRELNSPNDVVVAEDGSIYFTDPPYGRNDGPGVARERELDFQGVYRIAPGAVGEPQLVVAEDEFDRPNGLCLSPDGGTLYVDDTSRGEIKAFAIARDGSLGGSRVVASGIGPDPRRGSPDGIKSDALGNLWVTGPGGVWVVSPSGEHLGTVLVPEKAANLNWGGPGWSQLYVTASTSLYRIRTRVSGSPASYMRLG